MSLTFKLMPHQEDFVFDTSHRFVGFKGGYGTGKSKSFCYKGILCAMRNPGKLGALMEPINSMVTTDLVPTWERTLEEALGPEDKMWKRTSGTHHTYELYFPGQRPSKVMLLGAENHNRLRGKNFAWWGVDEFDTITPLSLQNAVLEQLLARLRTGEHEDSEQGFFVSTPEGFSGLYQFFVEDEQRLQKEAAANGEEYVSDRKLYTASSRSNYLLKPSYFKSMESKYPAQLLAAYIDGEFVNMARGAVHPEYDSVENATDLHMNSPELRNLPLNLGVDFNVKGRGTTGMSCVLTVVKDNNIYVVGQMNGDRSTPALIENIKNQDWFKEGREFYIHPDKSGNAEDSTSGTSDHILLAQAFGDDTLVLEDNLGRRSNPEVVDRINAVNGRIKNGAGRNLFVNPSLAPDVHNGFIKQPYNDQGKPLKDGKIDGPMDAIGYVIWYYWPIRKHHWSQGGSVTG